MDADVTAEQTCRHLENARDGLVKALALHRSVSGYRAGLREKVLRALEETDDALDTILQRGRPGVPWS